MRSHYFKDTPDSSIQPDEIEVGKERISGGQNFKIKMAQGGGFSGYIEIN